MQALQDLILPMNPPQRRVAIPFRHCSFLHISAQEHGFGDSRLLVQVYADGLGFEDYSVIIHAQTFLVRVLFHRLVAFVMDGPDFTYIDELLTCSGTVVITGTATVPVSPFHRALHAS